MTGSRGDNDTEAAMAATHLSEAKEAYIREGQRMYIYINGAGAGALLVFVQAIWDKAGAAEVISYILWGIMFFAAGVAISTLTYLLRHLAFVKGPSKDGDPLYFVANRVIPIVAVLTFVCGVSIPTYGLSKSELSAITKNPATERTTPAEVGKANK